MNLQYKSNLPLIFIGIGLIVTVGIGAILITKPPVSNDNISQQNIKVTNGLFPSTAAYYHSPQTPTVVTRQLSPSPLPTLPLPAEWTIYKNEQYGYQIKYPKDWQVIEAKLKTHPETQIGSLDYLINKERQKVTFIEQSSEYGRGEFRIEVLANLHQFTLDEWMSNNQGPFIRKIIDTVLAGQNAKRLSLFSGDAYGFTSAIVTVHNGPIYSLKFAGEGDPLPPTREEAGNPLIYIDMLNSYRLFAKNKQIYNQMVSSFKFTP